MKYVLFAALLIAACDTTCFDDDGNSIACDYAIPTDAPGGDGLTPPLSPNPDASKIGRGGTTGSEEPDSDGGGAQQPDDTDTTGGSDGSGTWTDPCSSPAHGRKCRELCLEVAECDHKRCLLPFKCVADCVRESVEACK